MKLGSMGIVLEGIGQAILQVQMVAHQILLVIIVEPITLVNA